MKKRIFAILLSLCMALSLAPTSVFAYGYDSMTFWTETNVTAETHDKKLYNTEIRYSHAVDCTLYEKGDPDLNGSWDGGTDSAYVGKVYKIQFNADGVAVVDMRFNKDEFEDKYAGASARVYFGLYKDQKLIHPVGEGKGLSQGELNNSDRSAYYAYKVEKDKVYYLGVKSCSEYNNKPVKLDASVRFYRSGDGTFDNKLAFIGVTENGQKNMIKFNSPGTGNIRFDVSSFYGNDDEPEAILTLLDKNKKEISSKAYIGSGSSSAEFSGLKYKSTYYLQVETNYDSYVTAFKIKYKYVTPKFTVDFNANGGKKLSSSSKTVTSGNTIGTLPTVSRSGYKFLGWYTKKSGGKKISTGTKIKKNQTVYAHWTKAYTVKFNVNGGKKLKTSSKTVACGNKAGTLPAPAKTGYRFLGWYTKKSGGTKVTASTKIKANRTLYAHWKKVYSVHGSKSLYEVLSLTQEPVEELKEHRRKPNGDEDHFYLGTAYGTEKKGGITPNGIDGKGGEMNCTGFIVAVLQRCGAKIKGYTPKHSGWRFVNWLIKKNVKFTKYQSISDAKRAALKGNIKPGDLLWYGPKSYSYNKDGTVKPGIKGKVPSKDSTGEIDNHWAFYWGKNKEGTPLQWHSALSKPGQPGNRINGMQGRCSLCYVYVFHQDKPYRELKGQ